VSEPRAEQRPALDQRRARHALRAVDDVLEGLPERSNQVLYRSYVDQLGPVVLMNGLGQALAGELATGSGALGKAHQLLAKQVVSWLCDPLDGVFRDAAQASPMVMLEKLCSAPQATYVRAQSEALAWLAWHTRVIRARIQGDDVGSVG
jgi:CRISPR-associated protein Cmr5